MSDSESFEHRPEGHPLAQAKLVLFLGVFLAVALAGVDLGLRERIVANKTAETYSEIPRLVPGADAQRTEALQVWVAGKTQRIYKAFSATGEHLGFVLPTSGSGFSDRIELLIGLDAQGQTLTGLYVLDQKETPGLGDHIKEAQFQARFAGAQTPLTAVKGDSKNHNEIKAIVGATVSSQSVCDIVNRAVSGLDLSTLTEATHE